jgi:hypothetical protein
MPKGLLTVNEVFGIADKKAERNREMYKELLEMCYKKIKRKAKDNKCRSVTFVLPPFLIGKPLYNKDHALRYIKEKLRRGGFHAETMGDSAIYIEWKREHKEPDAKKPPPSTSNVDLFLHSAKRFLG